MFRLKPKEAIPSGLTNSKDPPKSRFPMELDVMILERTPAESLKNASRVRKAWRTYTEHNVERMRCRATQVSIKDLSLMSVDQREDLENIPSWWPKPVKKVVCHLGNDIFPLQFVARVDHLEHLHIEVYNYENLLDLLENAPEVDSLYVNVCKDGLLLVDSFLEVLIRRSWIHPAEFASLGGKHRFTLLQLIRYIEENHFTNLLEHCMEVNRVQGSKRDWTDWVSFNTLDSRSDQSRRWEFYFRGEEYQVCIGEFV